jgi:Uncharacterized conserved protein
MAKKPDASKQEFAFLLYMNGDLQKDIAERVGVSAKTIGTWIDKEGWKEKRSGRNISRTELINKGLLTMNKIMEDMLADKDAKSYSAHMDQLIKCANAIEKLDKKNNVVNDMDAFMNFNSALQSWIGTDKEITVANIKLINRLQDKYITHRLSNSK